MIARFFVIWIVVTTAAFLWMWIAKPSDRGVAKLWIRRGAWSAVVSIVAVLALLLLNNISGV